MEFKKGIQRHPNGGMYNILEFATHSETLERYVVYREIGIGNHPAMIVLAKNWHKINRAPNREPSNKDTPLDRLPKFAPSFCESNPVVIKKGIYRHFKGNEYEVIGLAIDSATLSSYVVYRALYGEKGVWVRPVEMWNETVERDGKVFKRFELVEEK